MTDAEKIISGLNRQLSEEIAASRSLAEKLTKLSSASRALMTRSDFWGACANSENKVTIPGEFDVLAEALGLKFCEYCYETDSLRITRPGSPCGRAAPLYGCENCFVGQDDGPCFDDLEPLCQ